MSYHLKSKNQLVVELFMAKTGDARQAVPANPGTPSLEIRLLRARLMLEECLETIQKGLGIQVSLRGLGADTIEESARAVISLDINEISFREHPHRLPNLVELADGLADCEVVNLGTASAAGIAHQPVFEEVMRNNLAKFGPGHRIDAGGKLIKPPKHKPPDINRVLAVQRLGPGEAIYANDGGGAL